MSDAVNKPKHYNSGKLEVIDVIKDSSSSSEFEGFLSGNIKKYILRYQFKNGVEDLKKAKVYLEWLIQHVENKE